VTITFITPVANTSKRIVLEIDEGERLAMRAAGRLRQDASDERSRDKSGCEQEEAITALLAQRQHRGG